MQRMGSMCNSLFRFCCEAQDNDEDEHRRLRRLSFPTGMFLESGTMGSRMSHRTASTDTTVSAIDAYQHSDSHALDSTGLENVTGIDSVGAEGERNRTSDEATCCRPSDPHSQGIHDFFRRLVRDRWRPSEHSYDIMRQGSQDSQDEENDSFTPTKKPIPVSPLRLAVEFDSSKDVPCIHADEIVLPGSLLQKEMAKQMMSAKLLDADDECVICMEAFDPSNPRMPTLCGCGENKTFFHLPCLYQWLEQSRECPSCRSTLTWEEF